MNMDCSGKSVLVTGGGRGIGAAIATVFARAGAKVAVTDIDTEGAAKTARRIRAEGHEAELWSLDVSKPPAVTRVFQEVARALGGIDVLINNAGITSHHTISQMTVEDWREVVEVNLNACFYCTKEAVPYMRERGEGSIVLISSVAAKHIAFFSGAHYAATKTALVGFTRHAAFELGPYGIRVNAIGPGPMTNAMGGVETDAAELDRLLGSQPLGRAVEPEEIGHAALFLSSSLASAITGVYLPVDGGFLAGRGEPLDTYFELQGEKLER